VRLEQLKDANTQRYTGFLINGLWLFLSMFVIHWFSLLPCITSLECMHVCTHKPLRNKLVCGVLYWTSVACWDPL